MKKLFIAQITVLTTFLSVYSIAQEGTVKFKNPFDSAKKTNSFGAMYVLPVGDFGSTDLDKGGFARAGWGLYFDSKSTFKSGLSFISHSTYAWVPLDQEAMAKALTNGIGFGTARVSGGKHKPFLTTIGLGYDFKAASFLTIGISAQTGILYNSFKALEVTIIDPNGNTLVTADFKYDSEFSLAYVFGAKFNFSLIKDILSFQVYADYSGAKFQSYLRSQPMDFKTTQNIQMVNIGAGFAFHSTK
jgi:hypothetical protein